MIRPRMKSLLCSLTLVVAFSAGAAFAEEKPAAPTVDEQLAGLQAMCASASEAHTARQTETSLFDRLGGEKKIHELTREVMRLHSVNPAIHQFVDDVDAKKVAYRVAQFMISGTGGPQVYEGPTLTESHLEMKLTNADFLSAGGDVIQAMKNMEYGQEEIDEVICIFMHLRALVVIPEDAEISSSR
jgi:hemoglobin